MAYSTEDEVRAAKVAAMPALLGELHFKLWNEVAWLHMKWSEFRALFATSAEQFELFNTVAPDFFYHLESMWWEDTLLHLCRITDPPKIRKHERLSLTQLPAFIPDDSLRAQVELLISETQKTVKFARDWRNRRLAHKELPPLDGRQPQPLADSSRKHVEDALQAIRETMDCIQMHYEKTERVPYQRIIEPLGGAASLLFYLQKGLEAQQKEEERFLSLKRGR